MKGKPQILFLEDVPEDFLLVNCELSGSGLSFDTTRVETKEAFLKELEEHPPDLILSDHGLHDFDAFSALALAKEKTPNVPVILLTGSLGEDVGGTAFKRGATDFVLKHRLVELGPAVRRALHLSEQTLAHNGQVLQAGDERYRLLVESIRDYAIYLLDTEGNIVSWNEGAEFIHGYSARDAIGMSNARFFTPEDVQKGRPAEMLRIAAREGRCRTEGWRVRKDGTRFWTNSVVTALRDDAGRLIGFSKVARDTSDRKRMEDALCEGEQRLSLAVDAAQLGTWDYNHETGRAEWSDRCKAALGLPPDTAASFDKFISRVHPEDRARVEQTIRQTMTPGNSGRYENEYRALWPDGTVRWLISKGQVFFREVNGVREPARFIGALLDVTDRKQAEQALQEQIRRFNAELEQRVAQRTAQLEAANKELEAFSYSVSHDLRAPLRHIHGFADLLYQSADDKIGPASREYLRIITESARQMGRLIDALLAFSRMGRAAMHRTKVNMNTLMASVLHDFHYDLEGRKVEWIIPDLPEVVGDPSLLRQVLLNLISNALKYTRSRDLARIEIGAICNPQETVFFVRDNGVGFDMQYADKLFGVFQRLHGTTQYEGTGIGLANVRRIVQRHGGRTWAEAAPDRGATFYFSLPRVENPAAK